MIEHSPASNPAGQGGATQGSPAPRAASLTAFGDGPAQPPADVAVVIPTTLRPTIVEAVRSVFAQDLAGRIQLLIGVDNPEHPREPLLEALRAAPPHCRALLLDPGYSTSVRHGGLHPARDGGMLRTVLTYLANARLVAYLDDDNWWAPDHLSSLAGAIAGRSWAWSLRWFVHPRTRRPVAIDDWESVGPGQGIFQAKFGGFVDPSCLMIDKLRCDEVIRWWGIPLHGDVVAMSADRHVFHWLKASHPGAGTGRATAFYVMNEGDGLHPRRVARLGARYEAAGGAEP
jgi:hypothetical protein